MTGFRRFSSGFSEKQEKRALRPSESVEGRRLSGRTGSHPGSSFRISSPKPKILVICLPSSHRGLHLQWTLLVFSATHPVRWTPSSEPLVGRFAQFLRTSSLLGPTPHAPFLA